MSSLRVSLQASRFFEHFLLRTDVARALRSSVAMVAAWVACLLTGHAAEAVLVATAAQNVAMPDLRGDYRGRFVIMLALTVLISISVLTGIVAGHGVLAATLAIGVLSLFAGCWRHLSGDYGPNFFGHAWNTATYVVNDPELGWQAFGGNLIASKTGIKITPLDSYRARA